MTEEINTIPFIISNNPKLMTLWEQATQEGRTAAVLISEFRTSTSSHTIEAYFDFADKWYAAFPKSSESTYANGKLYDYGEKAIKTGAKLAGTAASTIYAILKTTRLFSRDDYPEIEAKAKENGVVIYWTHLRFIANGTSDNLNARTKATEAVVQKQMTETQLKALIRELVPKSKPISTSSQKLVGLIEDYRRFSRDYRLSDIIAGLTQDYTGDIELGQIVLTQLSDMTACLAELQELLATRAAEVQRASEMILSKMTGAEEPAEDGDIFYETSIPT